LHVVGVVHCVAHCKAMLRVFLVAIARMELRGLLETRVLGVGVDAFPL
jgi:hypothetical protein